MHAASSYLEVGELVRVEARRFEAQRAMLMRTRPLLRLFIEFPVSLLIGFVVRRVNRAANDLVAHAVWFRGMHDQVATLPSRMKVEPALELLSLLETMSTQADGVCRGASKLVEQRRRRRASRVDLTQALEKVVQSSTQLRNEIDEFRACILEFQGQHGTFRADPTFNRLAESADSMITQVGKLRSGDVGDLDPELLAEAEETLQSLNR